MPRFSFFASESCSVRGLVQSVLSAVAKIKLLPHPQLTADENLYIVADHRPWNCSILGQEMRIRSLRAVNAWYIKGERGFSEVSLPFGKRIGAQFELF